MYDLIHDLRFAFRSLVRRRWSATLAVVTLSLGIGGATTIFSVVDGVLIGDLPYGDPETLVSVWRAWPGWRGDPTLDRTWDHIHFPTDDFRNISRNATTLVDVAAHMSARRASMTLGNRSEEVSVGLGSAGLFRLLGVVPALGRSFLADEALPSAGPGARVAVLSHEFWQTRFGGDREVLGRLVDVADQDYEIVGVLPPGFRLPSDIVAMSRNGGAPDAGLRDLWLPLGDDGAECGNCLEVVARLTPGQTVEAARDELQSLLITHPGDPPDQLARVEKTKQRITQDIASPLMMLLLAAGVLLGIACLSVAGLMVGEAASRRDELSVRAALGASHQRIVRQLLTECTVLGALGACGGVLLALVSTDALLSVAPPIPRLDEVGMSVRVLAFSALTGLTTSILFGVFPCWLFLRGTGLPHRSPRAGQGREGRRLQSAVVATQTGLTVVLLVVGGLFARTLLQLRSVDMGFSTRRLATFMFTAPSDQRTDSARLLQFQLEVVQAAAQIGGVNSVTAANEIPFPGGRFSNAFRFVRSGEFVSATFWNRSVLPSYHETLGIRPVALADRQLGFTGRHPCEQVARGIQLAW